MRQVSILRRRKLELEAESVSGSESSGSEELSPRRRNPFAEESSETGSEDGSESDVEAKAADTPVEKETPIAYMQRFDNDQPAKQRRPLREKRISPVPSPGVLRTPEAAARWPFQLDQKHFTVEVAAEAARLAGKHNSIVVQKNAWLMPHSTLLTDILKHKSGLRWQNYDPTAEIYFTMRRHSASSSKIVEGVGAVDSVFYDWYPTERYLNSWSFVEMLVSSGDINGLFEFTAQYPYHPSANLAIAQYYIMQHDQFDTSHKYIEKALAAFQVGLVPSLRFSGTDGAPVLNQLHGLDLRRVANALSVLGDDLAVVWTPEDDTEQEASARDREVREALSIPENGNLLFLKCLHMYGWSLLHRGHARPALEMFRFINGLSLQNDVAHSLLIIGEAALRAGEYDLYHRYNRHYLGSVHELTDFKVFHDLVPAVDGAVAVAQLQDKAGSDATHPPFTDLLECFLPHYLFGTVFMMLRQADLRSRKRVDRTQVETLLSESISVEDFYEYAARRWTAEEYAGTATLREICLALMYALWQYPQFCLQLRQARSDGTKALSTDEQRVFGLELHRVTNTVEWRYELLRSRLLESYVKLASEYWVEFYDVLVFPCFERVSTYHALRTTATLDYPTLLTAGLDRWNLFVQQYQGVRASEFDGQKYVLADALLNSATETVGSNRGYAVRQALRQEGSQNPLARWWRAFAARTGSVNPREGVVLNFLRTLMPWADTAHR